MLLENVEKIPFLVSNNPKIVELLKQKGVVFKSQIGKSQAQNTIILKEFALIEDVSYWSGRKGQESFIVYKKKEPELYDIIYSLSNIAEIDLTDMDRWPQPKISKLINMSRGKLKISNRRVVSK